MATTPKGDYPKLKDRVRTEAEITKEIRYYLNTCGIWHWKNWSGPMSPKGIPDIIGIYRGKFLAVEIKKPGGKPTDLQKEFLTKVQINGGISCVVHSWEELAKFLESL